MGNMGATPVLPRCWVPLAPLGFANTAGARCLPMSALEAPSPAEPFSKWPSLLATLHSPMLQPAAAFSNQQQPAAAFSF